MNKYLSLLTSFLLFSCVACSSEVPVLAATQPTPLTIDRITLGPLAGTDPIIRNLTIDGTDSNFQIGFNTGVNPIDKTLMFTVAYTAPKDHISHCTISPANLATAEAFTMYAQADQETNTQTSFSGRILSVSSETAVLWNVVCP